MFRRYAPNLDEVREKLMRLVGEYAGGIGMSREQVFSKAEKLLTRDVAEQFDGTVNKNAVAACQKIIGEEHLPALMAANVAPYLTLIVNVAEFVMRKQTVELVKLRRQASIAGVSYYHNQISDFMEQKDYAGAELIAQNMLTCANLWKHPDWLRMLALFQLAVAQAMQQKKDKAKQNAEAALEEYDKLSDAEKTSSDVQNILTRTKQLIPLL